MAQVQTPIHIELTETERAELERIARAESLLIGRQCVRGSSSASSTADRFLPSCARSGGNGESFVSGPTASCASACVGWTTRHGAGGQPVFPPAVAMHLVKLACELPDAAGRSPSLWTCAELARTLRRHGVVDSISPQHVQRILQSHRLKPWRVHHWLSDKTPRDAAFRETVLELCDLYTRSLDAHERVLSLDEKKTSIQPRPRTAPDRPALPNCIPVHVEHESARAGALNLIAAFDTRSGEVIGICRKRKRQI